MGIAYAETFEDIAQLQSAVSDVFVVEDRTIPDAEPESVRFRGRFMADPDAAYALVSQRFRALGFTPFFRNEDGQDAIIAVRGVIEAKPSRPWINVVLFVLTVASVFYTGVVFVGDPVAFTVSLMAILLCHEFGHYLMARHHNVAVTLPYFIPLPFISPFGTMGAAIVMKEPMPNRKVTFDIGVAGPLAGIVVAIPVLIIGLMMSHVEFVSQAQPSYQEGQSILYLLLKYLVFGRILPSGGYDVMLHPVAWAGWIGLLVTFFNLFPAGQLDGGHVAYVLFGNRARYISQGVVVLLLILGLLGLPELFGGPSIPIGYAGWLLWAVLIRVFGLGHPQSLNEVSRLDNKRRALAVFMLILFVLLFMPVPLREIM